MHFLDYQLTWTSFCILWIFEFIAFEMLFQIFCLDFSSWVICHFLTDSLVFILNSNLLLVVDYCLTLSMVTVAIVSSLFWNSHSYSSLVLYFKPLLEIVFWYSFMWFQWLSTFSMCNNHLESLLKYRIPGSTLLKTEEVGYEQNFFKKWFSWRVIYKHTLGHTGVCHVVSPFGQKTRSCPPRNRFPFCILLGILVWSSCESGKVYGNKSLW